LNVLLSNSTDIFAGGEDYVLILARYLRARGHVVRVSALPGHLLLAKCSAAGIDIVPLRFEGMHRVFKIASELRHMLRTLQIDVVHSNANYDRTAAALAAVGTRARHVASIHSAHSIQHNITHWLRNRWGTDHFIADAEAVRAVLMAEDHIPGERITVVPIGVEADDEVTRPQVRAQARSALGIDDATIVIGTVARLVPFKGHTYLLRTASEVLRSHPGCLFLIVGDGELQEDLERQARALGIEKSVRFLGFRDDLHRVYPAFDIYCHSSLELAAEAFPLAILRALAAGLPVACTNVGGIAMMVEEGVSGYLTPPENPAALAVSLRHMIAAPALRTSMGAASLALFKKKFHASAMAEAVERVYIKAQQQ
jgi:glycosyltransferase involved in cell wall biosynthesis